MLSVIASQDLHRDALDIEFDAVYKADQLKRGVRHNGLMLVVDNTRKPAQAATPVQTATPSLMQRLFGSISA